MLHARLSQESLQLRKSPRKRGFVEFFRRLVDPPASYVEGLEEGALLFTMGFKQAGLVMLAETARQTQHPGTYEVLSLAQDEWENDQDSKN